jgi:DNA-binding MarR family transcriptional regulator
MSVTDVNHNRGTEIVEILVRISKKTHAVLSLRLAEMGLSIGDDDILLALEQQTPVTTTSLSSLINVRSTTLLNAIDRLADQGYVEMIADNLVRLTGDGLDMQSRVRRFRVLINSEIARPFDLERLIAMTNELVSLDNSLSRSLARIA